MNRYYNPVQTICGSGAVAEIPSLLEEILAPGAGVLLITWDGNVVKGESFAKLKEAFRVHTVLFNESNPTVEQLFALYSETADLAPEAVVAVGGGSALDVAKCIKLFAKADPNRNYLEQEWCGSDIPLIAVPTTAGTGSESTRYAVIYYGGKKNAVTHASIVPDIAVLDSRVLHTLPLYQKKCTMLDALCQGIESWWSVNSTAESRVYSELAVRLIMDNYRRYIFHNDEQAAKQVMLAANYAGRAIHITQTTAPHAMSYQLTSLYHLPHGHAVAVCLPHVWRYMQQHPQACIDSRGGDFLIATFLEIAQALGEHTAEGATARLDALLAELGIQPPISHRRSEDIPLLAKSVNPIRLKNNPIALSDDVLFGLYTRIVQ